MKLMSISAIMAFVIYASLGADDPSFPFWSILYGFALMLAVFNLLNLKIKWAAGFGTVSYAVIAFKMYTTPVASGSIATGPAQIIGLIAAAIFCACLLVTSIKNIRQISGELPDVKS
jgi:peptidoglycan/LPS O-acetylase OafA/YrhL